MSYIFFCRCRRRQTINGRTNSTACTVLLHTMSSSSLLYPFGGLSAKKKKPATITIKYKKVYEMAKTQPFSCAYGKDMADRNQLSTLTNIQIYINISHTFND